MRREPISTQINNCRDCYRCVRHCPVKAIQIRDAHAEIIYDRCTFCGTCVNECPNAVKTIRNDVDRFTMAFLSKRKVIVSLAPSYVSEFKGYADNFVRALYRLGFHAFCYGCFQFLGAGCVHQSVYAAVGRVLVFYYFSGLCGDPLAGYEQFVFGHFPHVGYWRR